MDNERSYQRVTGPKPGSNGAHNSKQEHQPGTQPN
jgi:hypothetical protein